MTWIGQAGTVPRLALSKTVTIAPLAKAKY